jgi:REP element-mobilizing transposase RayT
MAQDIIHFIFGKKAMEVGGYKIRNQKEIHFVSFAVVEWVDVFTRKEYRDTLLDSLRFCQESKQLRLHGWCVMSSHVHLLASSGIYDLSGTSRDFKKFTSRKIIAAIINSKQESRRTWMIEIFRQAGRTNSRNEDYQFWRQDNQPKECYSPAFTIQKLNYIHNNPVEAGIVNKPEEYLYSSAGDYYHKKNCGLLKIDFI